MRLNGYLRHAYLAVALLTVCGQATAKGGYADTTTSTPDRMVSATFAAATTSTPSTVPPSTTSLDEQPLTPGDSHSVALYVVFSPSVVCELPDDDTSKKSRQLIARRTLTRNATCIWSIKTFVMERIYEIQKFIE